MSEILLEVILILGLIMLNGFFAAAEMAIVSARRGHLQARAAAGYADAWRALALRQDPGRFLSTVQIGITLVGTLASAIGGASVVRFLEPRLATLPLPWAAIYAEVVALLLVVVLISYLSLVLGELVPKELALRRAEVVAVTLSGPLDRLSRLVHPLVWFLTRSSNLILRLVVGGFDLLFPAGREADAAVTDEEILAMLHEGVAEGAFHPSEQTLVQGIFRFADWQVREIMKPRTDISAVAADAPLAQVLESARLWGYTRYPVYEGDLDHIVGVLHIKDLLLADENLQRPAKEVARAPLLVPSSLRLIEMLRWLKMSSTHMAIVLDEFGGTAGLVTLEDLLEEIVGSIEDEYPHPDPQIERHPQGALAVPGMLSVGDLAEELSVTLATALPYNTVAGLILHRLGHIPRPGEEVEWEGYRLVVQAMEAHRIRQVAVIPVSGRHKRERSD